MCVYFWIAPRTSICMSKNHVSFLGGYYVKIIFIIPVVFLFHDLFRLISHKLLCIIFHKHIAICSILYGMHYLLNIFFKSIIIVYLALTAIANNGFELSMYIPAAAYSNRLFAQPRLIGQVYSFRT